MSSIGTYPHQPDAEGGATTRANLISFQFKWKMLNFSLLAVEKGRSLLSPIFSMGTSGEYKWQLEAFPRGNSALLSATEYMSVHLKSLESKNNDVVKAKVEISCCTGNNKVNSISSAKVYTFGKGCSGMELCVFSDIREGMRLTVGYHLTPLINDAIELICDITIIEEGHTTKNDKPEVFNEVAEYQMSNEDLLRGLFESSRFHDVVLIAACGREFRVHKAILAGRSAVFLAMFEHEMKEQRENRVNIADMDGDVLNEMLKFIYTGNLTITPTLAEDLLAAADKYQLEGLKSPCLTELGKSLSVENATKRLIIADLHRAVNLKTHVLRFISSHAKEVLETESFKSTNKTHPHLLNEVLITAMK